MSSGSNSRRRRTPLLRVERLPLTGRRQYRRCPLSAVLKPPAAAGGSPAHGLSRATVSALDIAASSSLVTCPSLPVTLSKTDTRGRDSPSPTLGRSRARGRGLRGLGCPTSSSKGRSQHYTDDVKEPKQGAVRSDTQRRKPEELQISLATESPGDKCHKNQRSLSRKKMIWGV